MGEYMGSTYLGFHALEEANSHSILISSIQMFLSGEAGRKYRKRIENEESDDNHVSPVRSKSDINRWRWYLAYFLIKNPSLLVVRKARIAEEKRLAKEAGTKSLPDPFFLDKINCCRSQN